MRQRIERAAMFAMLILFLINCVACSEEPKKYVGRHKGNPTSAPWIEKLGMLQVNGPMMEATPVLWNGKKTLVTYEMQGAYGKALHVYDIETGAHIGGGPSPLIFVSAFVHNGTMYVFGADEYQLPRPRKGNAIWMQSSTDLQTWTAPSLVIRGDSSTALFNNSVTEGPNGFVMAYEVCVTDNVCFKTRFLQSTDLVTWTEVGAEMFLDYYTACPTIHYVNGFYYVLSTADFGYVTATIIARSADLVNWSESPQAVVAPTDDVDRNSNTSDLDLVEVGGEVYMIYASISQVGAPPISEAGVRQARYAGTLQEFLERFFN